MSKEVKKLADEHLAAAKLMVLRHRKKKSCNKCYDRGFIGVNEENMLIPCPRCVDAKPLFDEWKVYVKAKPELDALYGDSLNEPDETAAKS